MPETFEEVSDATRKVMRANRSRDTRPEMIVRRLLHSLGYRYRIHRSDLPGRPDLSFGPRQKVVFVHGCFWHAHDDPACKVVGKPKTRAGFWQAKFERNRARDNRSVAALTEMGWQALVIWECELRNIPALQTKLVQFLDGRAGD
jgi:DNA mismatch endonuclease, patch repair protein